MSTNNITEEPTGRKITITSESGTSSESSQENNRMGSTETFDSTETNERVTKDYPGAHDSPTQQEAEVGEHSPASTTRLSNPDAEHGQLGLQLSNEEAVAQVGMELQSTVPLGTKAKKVSETHQVGAFQLGKTLGMGAFGKASIFCLRSPRCAAPPLQYTSCSPIINPSIAGETRYTLALEDASGSEGHEPRPDQGAEDDRQGAA